MPGRPRKPTAKHKITGAFEKNPARGRARNGEPQPEPELGMPPAAFDSDPPDLRALHVGAWNELAAQCAAGVLTQADRILLEMAARLVVKMRASLATSADYGTLLRSLSQMGMTPADRSRINLGAGKDESAEDDPFAQFMRPPGASTRPS